MAQTFQYKVRDKAGNMVTGTLVADSELLVLQRLREMGYTPLEVGKEKKGLNLEINIRKAKVKLKDLSVFSRQFATMINSGLPILRALSILSEQTENKLLAETLTACRMDVEQGSSLSGAMQKHPKVFNDLYISMVKSGEMGGSLDTTLLKLAAMLEREVHLRGQDQVGDDLSGGRGRPRPADHVGDAAVRRAPVQGHLRAARRHPAAADTSADHDVRR